MVDEDKEIERIYVIPLRQAKLGRSTHAAPRAVKTVRGFLSRHMKVTADDVWIDDSLNTALWAYGRYNIPSKIRVRAVKFEDGVVEASLPELGFKKSRRELLKEEREKKEPILKREEVEAGEGAVGAEGYEIAPAAGGDVKIKKKKAPKTKEPKEKKEVKKPSKKEKAEEKEKNKEEKKAKKASLAEKKKASSARKSARAPSKKSGKKK
jgi:large subunit ribosomal protein L31e